MSEILENLNENQRNIVTDTEGYVLVLAGAGSGKTRVLTHRVAYIVKEKKVFASSVLAITFTNKATAEMRERLVSLLGEENNVWISTFHSLCASLLRREAEAAGYGANFSIYDESDSLRVIKKVLREKHLENEPIKDKIKNYISDAKNAGLSPEEYWKDTNGLVNDADIIREVYERYEELLKDANAMDFDDLLQKTKNLFVEHPDVLEKYQNRFRYIHVDEFQDTNKVQYEIVEMLAAKWGNLFVVGDDDQSIYGWRGAELGNILFFDKKHPGCKVYKLLENYRSSSSILDCANNVIRNNKNRHEKELFTNRGTGVRTEFYKAYNDYNEADWVIDNIVSLKRYYGYSNKDFAILVRMNSLTRLFENRLSESRLSYRVLGGFKFFDRKEIQDVLSYMRMVSNPKDAEAIERIINFPARGIGDITVEKLSAYARQSGNDFLDVILNIDSIGAGIIGAGAVKKVSEFRAVVSDLLSHKDMPLNEFVKYLVERVNFALAYTSTGKEEDEVRLENIGEFVRQVGEHCTRDPRATLDSFLQTVCLAPEADNEIRDGENITLATMHSVKGLEFKVVFIIGCEEDIFPSSQSKRGDSVEEERRLMYVAVTRARERLYISSADKRFRFNKVQESLPSRFIAEAKGTAVSIEDPYKVYAERRAYIEGRGGQPSYRSETPKPFTPIITPRNAPAPANKDISKFTGGAKIRHKLYGEGTIILVTGSGTDATATVAFPTLGVKKFILALAPLELAE